LFDPAGNWLGNAGSYSLVPFEGRYFALYLGGNTLFNHVNALDSASMRTFQSGAEAEDILFYPWGDVWEVQGSGGYNFANIPYRDVTTSTDITTARFSSPNFGRWLSADPLGVKAVKLEDPQTWNMYAYVRNNPTTLTDPTGLQNQGGVANTGACSDMNSTPCQHGHTPCVESSAKCGGDPAQAIQGVAAAETSNTEKGAAIAAEKDAVGRTRAAATAKKPKYEEFAGWVITKNGKTFTYTVPVTFGEQHVDMDRITVPEGYAAVAMYHTHADPGSWGEGFSGQDMSLADRWQMNSYVGMSYSGNVRQYIPGVTKNTNPDVTGEIAGDLIYTVH
jgi:RHS repeat-associated protein